MIPDNAWGTRITASAGTSLETPYSSHTIRTLSGRKKVYNPKILFLYAASLGHPFGHCRRFPTAASRRSMGRVLSPIVAGHLLKSATRQSLGKPLPYQQADRPQVLPKATKVFVLSNT